MRHEKPSLSDPGAVRWLRAAAPYINALRGEVVVLCLAPGATMRERLLSIASDVSLLHSLGVSIVLCHGTAAGDSGVRGLIHESPQPIAETDGPVDEVALREHVARATEMRLSLEAALSIGHADGAARRQRLRVVGGNLVVARPVGVRNGVDHGHAGRVRRVDAQAIRTLVKNEAIVLIPPLAVSGVGDLFVLDPAEVAVEVAVQLGAAKLVYLSPAAPLREADGSRISNLDMASATALRDRLRADPVAAAAARVLAAAVDGCQRGVQRAHLLDADVDGALVSELYTPDGVGTMVNADSYDRVRTATLEDIGSLLALLEPLQLSGTLLERTRESLETDIARFRVLERDGLLVACAAAYPFAEDGAMELACLAVRSDYANSGRGAALLATIEREAQRAGMNVLFVFTTQTSHWFRERGFEPADVASAPAARRATIAPGRNSVMLCKRLEATPRAPAVAQPTGRGPLS